MSEKKEVRNSVKLILLNANNELLLMSTDDKGIQGKEGNYNGKFWQMIGGKIEKGETLREAVYRELYEETGLRKEQVEVQEKPAWYGEVDLMMHGKLTRIKQNFVLAKTSSTNVNLENLTEEEKPVCIIAKTIKGKGISYMENKAEWHGKAPNEEQYKMAMEELA